MNLTAINSYSLWKNSAWLGASSMIDKETSLAKIIGQMSLSRNTDVMTQPCRGSHLYMSIKRSSPCTKLYIAICLRTPLVAADRL